MYIFIRYGSHLSGVFAQASDSIESLKYRWYLGVPFFISPRSFSLFMGDVLLEDNNLVSRYDIRNGTELQIDIRYRGEECNGYE